MNRILLLPFFFFCFSVVAHTQCSSASISVNRPDNPGADPDGPYCPGELVRFDITVEFTSDAVGTGNNCQWIQGIIPSIGVGWDLANYPIDEEAPGSGWFWLEDEEVDLNVTTSAFGIQANSAVLMMVILITCGDFQFLVLALLQ